MADYQPKYLPGDVVPVVLTAAVTGGVLVTVAGAISTDASTTVMGVASKDGAIGDTIGLFRVGIQRLIAQATITAGQPLCAGGTAGAVRPWVSGTDVVPAYIGTALTAAASTAVVEVALFAV